MAVIGLTLVGFLAVLLLIGGIGMAIIGKWPWER